MSKIDEVGIQLFAAFQKHVPMAAGKGGAGRKKSDSQIASELDGFYAEAKQIRLAAKLGVVARARVIRHFQQQLNGAGYPPELVSKVTFSLLLTAFVGS